VGKPAPLRNCWRGYPRRLGKAHVASADASRVASPPVAAYPAPTMAAGVTDRLSVVGVLSS